MSTHLIATAAVLKLLDPQPPHLSDEDVAALLDLAEKRSKAARKAATTRRKQAQKKEA